MTTKKKQKKQAAFNSNVSITEDCIAKNVGENCYDIKGFIF